MVKFIESELVLLKKEIDEMWTLVYNQLDRAGDAVLTLDRELAQQIVFFIDAKVLKHSGRTDEHYLNDKK